MPDAAPDAARSEIRLQGVQKAAEIDAPRRRITNRRRPAQQRPRLRDRRCRTAEPVPRPPWWDELGSNKASSRKRAAGLMNLLKSERAAHAVSLGLGSLTSCGSFSVLSSFLRRSGIATGQAGRGTPHAAYFRTRQRALRRPRTTDRPRFSRGNGRSGRIARWLDYG